MARRPVTTDVDQTLRREPAFGSGGGYGGAVLIEDEVRPIPKFMTNAALADAPASHSEAVRKGLLANLEQELSGGVKEVNEKVREIRQHARSVNWDRQGDIVNVIAGQVLDMRHRDIKRLAEALHTTAGQQPPQDPVGWVDVLHRWALREFEGGGFEQPET